MASDRILSIKELAEAAVSSLERINTAKLAALGRDQDSVAVGDARRFLDRLLYEIAPLCRVENASSGLACIPGKGHEGAHSADVGDSLANAPET